MSKLSTHLIETYEEDQKVIQPPFQPYGPRYIPIPRPVHLALTQRNTSFCGNSSNKTMDPNESWMSNHGQSFNSSWGGGGGGMTQWSEERIHMLQARLAKKLGPEYVTQRPGPGGGPKLSYIEGWKLINLANEVFGFNGWSSSIVSLTTDFIDVNEQGRISINVSAIVRITLQDGCFHEDVGCGQCEGMKSKAASLDKAKKEAVTDATKRALKAFGNVLGNCLYDKEYTKEVAKMRVPPAKFNSGDLERRPEFTDAGAPGTSRPAPQAQVTNVSKPTPAPVPSNIIPQDLRPRQQSPPRPATPLRSINEPQAQAQVQDEVYVDESFDAEFMDFGSDSFLDQLDERSFQLNGAGSSSKAQQVETPKAGQSKVTAPEQPAYHHRHRPDPQPAPQPQPQQRNQFAQRPMSRVSSENGLASSSTIKPPPSTTAAVDTVVVNTRSSGSESTATVVETPKPRVVGGFNLTKTHTNTTITATSNPNAKSARAQAIASAMNQEPIRAESPRIPSGGIDAVAAKANQAYRAHAAHLGLDENVDDNPALSLSTGPIGTPGAGSGEGGGGFNGFASARGVKRSSDQHERKSASPTKNPAANNPAYPVNRGNAPRRALGELTLGGSGVATDDWGAKRSRMG